MILPLKSKKNPTSPLGDRWFRGCFWLSFQIPFQGGVYPSLYPSPWTRNGGAAGGRQVCFQFSAGFLALQFFTFFCDPLFSILGRYWLHFDLLFGLHVGVFGRILRTSVRHPISRCFCFRFRMFFKEFSDV